MGAGEEKEEEGGWIKQQREAREKMQLLVSAFSNSQQDQYEVFRRSSFPKSSVKKIMQVRGILAGRVARAGPRSPF